ncbi:MAG: hypothetical protein JWM34_4131 [Ilumatobacteraceae bacterium]|nr:hypothetical protein [Ilumatobacteraceae bacterium]
MMLTHDAEADLRAALEWSVAQMPTSVQHGRSAVEQHRPRLLLITALSAAAVAVLVMTLVWGTHSAQPSRLEPVAPISGPAGSTPGVAVVPTPAPVTNPSVPVSGSVTNSSVLATDPVTTSGVTASPDTSAPPSSVGRDDTVSGSMTLDDLHRSIATFKQDLAASKPITGNTNIGDPCTDSNPAWLSGGAQPVLVPVGNAVDGTCTIVGWAYRILPLDAPKDPESDGLKYRPPVFDDDGNVIGWSGAPGFRG